MARNASFRGANLQYVSAPDSLNNLTDVTIDSSTDKDLLQYSSSAGKWADVAALTLPQINDTSSNHQYVFAVSELTADRTVTLPLLTGNDTFIFAAFAATMTNKTLTSPVLDTAVSGSAVLDQDDMSGNSATQLATQQSIKAYVDAQILTEDTLAELNGPASNDVLQYSGSAWVDRTYAEAGLVSLTGSETLTNKTLTAPTINGGTATALTDLDMTSGDKTILDTIGANTLTIGASGTTVTIPGNLTVTGTQTTVSTTNTNISDKLITLNDGGSASSGTAVGIEVEEDSSATGYFKTAADRAGWELKAPSTAGVLSIDPSANSNTLAFGGSGKTFTISETATIDQDLATTANVTFANLTATGNVALGNAASDTVTVTGTILGASPLVFEGGTADGYETTLAITDPTADRTWTLPNATDTFVGLATADTLSNKTLASPVVTTGDINTPDIDGGTVDAITSLTVANNVDVGSYTVRASGFLADGLTAGQVVYTGTDGVLSSEAALAYNAGTNTLTATNIAGTLSTAAQGNVTSLGTLTALTVDNIALNGTTIGHTGDTDLLTLASGIVTVAGEVSMTTLDIGGTNVAATAAELNIIDGDTAASSTTVVDADRVVYNDNGTMKQVAVTDLAAYFDDEITAMPNLVTTAATTVGVLASGSIASGFGAIDTGSSNITTTGTVSAGSLTVTGTTTTVNSTTMTVVDPIIHLQTASGGGALASDTNKDVGLAMQYHNGSAAKTAFLGFDDTDSKLTYIPDATLSSEVVSGSVGTIKANLDGTVQTAAQGSITSLGTLTGLTVSGEVSMTTLDIGGTNVTSTAGELNILDGVTASTAELNLVDGVTSTTAELNLVDGSVANTVVNSKAVVYGSGGQLAGTLSTVAQTNVTSVGALGGGSITSGFGTIDTGSSAITTTGVITGGTVEATTDTAAGDNSAMGYTSVEGLVLTGQGSTTDVTIKNDADATVLSIPTGTTDAILAGSVAFGTSISSVSKVRIHGAYTGTRILSLGGSTLTANNAAEAATLWVDGALTEGASGANAIIAQARFDGVAITGGSGTTTNAATVYISSATTGAVSSDNEYALFVEAGPTRLDGTLNGYTIADMATHAATLFPQAGSGTGVTEANSVGRGPSVSFADSSAEQAAFWVWYAPASFNTLTKAVIRYVTTASGANLRQECLSNVDANGETLNSQQDSISATTVALTQNVWAEYDITDIFSGLAAGDQVQIRMNRVGNHAADTITTLEVSCLDIEWT